MVIGPFFESMSVATCSGFVRIRGATTATSVSHREEVPLQMKEEPIPLEWKKVYGKSNGNTQVWKCGDMEISIQKIWMRYFKCRKKWMHQPWEVMPLKISHTIDYEERN